MLRCLCCTVPVMHFLTVKTRHLGTEYTLLLNESYFVAGIVYFHFE